MRRGVAMSTMTTIAGQLDAKGLKVAIVATRFNDFIVDRLVGGALDYLERHGLASENITLVRIPGAFEMPLICKKLVASGKYDGVLALGAVIRGGTAGIAGCCDARYSWYLRTCSWYFFCWLAFKTRKPTKTRATTTPPIIVFLSINCRLTRYFYSCCVRRAASTNDTNRGCGRLTVLLYSGWYCVPTNQG